MRLLLVVGAVLALLYLHILPYELLHEWFIGLFIEPVPEPLCCWIPARFGVIIFPESNAKSRP